MLHRKSGRDRYESLSSKINRVVEQPIQFWRKVVTRYETNCKSNQHNHCATQGLRSVETEQVHKKHNLLDYAVYFHL